jgi:hypothetical protein
MKAQTTAERNEDQDYYETHKPQTTEERNADQEYFYLYGGFTKEEHNFIQSYLNQSEAVKNECRVQDEFKPTRNEKTL